MKAVVCKAWGPPESLVIEDRAPLEAGPGKVVVTVKAANVKLSDTLVIQNKYQTKPELPFIPGSEVAGVVKAVGAGVEGWKVGDRVLGDPINRVEGGLTGETVHGGLAEYCRLRAHQLDGDDEGSARIVYRLIFSDEILAFAEAGLAQLCQKGPV